jgi:hypothetical protein
VEDTGDMATEHQSMEGQFTEEGTTIIITVMTR